MSFVLEDVESVFYSSWNPSARRKESLKTPLSVQMLFYQPPKRRGKTRKIRNKSSAMCEDFASFFYSLTERIFISTFLETLARKLLHKLFDLTLKTSFGGVGEWVNSEKEGESRRPSS
jgi:hypothetical protein